MWAPLKIVNRVFSQEIPSLLWNQNDHYPVQKTRLSTGNYSVPVKLTHSIWFTQDNSFLLRSNPILDLPKSLLTWYFLATMLNSFDFQNMWFIFQPFHHTSFNCCISSPIRLRITNFEAPDEEENIILKYN
jgi:hypothetical protein